MIIISKDCVDIISTSADPTRNFFRVRFRNPKLFVGGKYSTPQWGQKAAMTIGTKYYGVKGCKITMAQPVGGRWMIQNVLIPKNGGVEMTEELALRIANHIQDRIEREGQWTAVMCRDNETKRYISKINGRHIERDERGRFAPHAAEEFGAENESYVCLENGKTYRLKKRMASHRPMGWMNESPPLPAGKGCFNCGSKKCIGLEELPYKTFFWPKTKHTGLYGAEEFGAEDDEACIHRYDRTARGDSNYLVCSRCGVVGHKDLVEVLNPSIPCPRCDCDYCNRTGTKQERMMRNVQLINEYYSMGLMPYGAEEFGAEEKNPYANFTVYSIGVGTRGSYAVKYNDIIEHRILLENPFDGLQNPLHRWMNRKKLKSGDYLTKQIAHRNPDEILFEDEFESLTDALDWIILQVNNGRGFNEFEGEYPHLNFGGQLWDVRFGAEEFGAEAHTDRLERLRRELEQAQDELEKIEYCNHQEWNSVNGWVDENPFSLTIECPQCGSHGLAEWDEPTAISWDRTYLAEEFEAEQTQYDVKKGKYGIDYESANYISLHDTFAEAEAVAKRERKNLNDDEVIFIVEESFDDETFALDTNLLLSMGNSQTKETSTDSSFDAEERGKIYECSCGGPVVEGHVCRRCERVHEIYGRDYTAEEFDAEEFEAQQFYNTCSTNQFEIFGRNLFYKCSNIGSVRDSTIASFSDGGLGTYNGGKYALRLTGGMKKYAIMNTLAEVSQDMQPNSMEDWKEVVSATNQIISATKAQRRMKS